MEDDRRVLGCIPAKLLFLPPRRTFEVWIELVLAHIDEAPLAIPEVEFAFNAAFATKFEHSNYHHETKDSPYFSNSLNFKLYSHFWLAQPGRTDSLTNAYGDDARRVIPDDRYVAPEPAMPQDTATRQKLEELRNAGLIDVADARFALAFRRSGYKPSSRTGRPPLLNYPCTFTVSSEGPNPTGGHVLRVHPRPFELGSWLPSAEKQCLRKTESISFWFYYPYSEDTASSADAPDHDLVALLHNVTLLPSQLHPTFEANLFPRVPYRFSIVQSNPPLTRSPRFDEDPPPWRREDYALYPMTTSDVFSEATNSIRSPTTRPVHDRAGTSAYSRWARAIRHLFGIFTARHQNEPTLAEGTGAEIACFMLLHDRKTQIERNIGVVVYSLVAGVLMNFVANFATDDKLTVFEGYLMMLFSLISGLIVYALLCVLRGRESSPWSLFRDRETLKEKSADELQSCLCTNFATFSLYTCLALVILRGDASILSRVVADLLLLLAGVSLGGVIFAWNRLAAIGKPVRVPLQHLWGSVRRRVSDHR